MPNLKKVSKAYEIETLEIKNHNEIDRKINYILKSKKPILCNVVVSENQRVIPKLEFGRPIHDLSPRLSEKEIKKNLNLK